MPALPTQKSINAAYPFVCLFCFFLPEAIWGLVGVFCESLSRNNVFEPRIIKSFAATYNSVKYNIAVHVINQIPSSFVSDTVTQTLC